MYLLGMLILFLSTSFLAAEQPTQRVSDGLIVLYDFQGNEGSLVRDVSGVGVPVDLRIEDTTAVRRSDGSLQFRRGTIAKSSRHPGKIIQRIKRRGEVTAELWVRSTKKNQNGPARILTLSKDSASRNFTVGQDGDRFDVRFRTTKTSENGIPSTASKAGTWKPGITHIAFTRSRDGMVRVYIDGQENSKRKLEGDTSNWGTDFELALGNELNGGRNWLGTYYLVAIYGRALTPQEIRENFSAGVAAATPAASLAKADPKATYFETKVAPLLADKCVECHDPATKMGDLDLTTEVASRNGGESGPALISGKHSESEMWQLIASDAMPKDRKPLSHDEKTIIKKWIDDGATWSLAAIDPAVYLHGGGETETWVRRLTVDEYIETIRATLGVDIAKEARELLPIDLRADGFSNTAYNLNVDLKHIEAYGRLAETIVDRMDVVKFAEKFSRRRRFTDDDMGRLVSRMGKWILRAPLDSDEVISYRGLTTTTIATGGDYEAAVELIIEAMLQSPRFLYRMETQRGDGSLMPVSEYELASRLSYTIWGGPPDEALIKAAENGDLYDQESVEKEARRMLKDPRARDHSLRFLSDWLNLRRLADLQPSKDRFPSWNIALADDMKLETLKFFEDIVWRQKLPLARLMNAQIVYASPRLATHYGLPQKPNDGDNADQLKKYDVANVPSRGGLLTQGSVLTVGGDDASMVTRGLLVMHELLRGVVKDPPPCVDTTPVPTSPGLSQRAISMKRIENETCGGCHRKFEPLAFGLEKFDGLGGYREKDEHGNQLREDGAILFPGAAQRAEYKTTAELMDRLANSDRVRQTITWKLTQFAVGRPLGANDAAKVDKIHAQATEAGGTYQETMVAIVLSDLVQKIRTETAK